MATHDHGAKSHSSANPGSIRRAVFSTDHKTIGRQYRWLALTSVLVGAVLSTLLRLQASWSASTISFLSGTQTSPERFAAVRLLHCSLVIFFVLTAAPQLGFGSFLLPLQIGAREMAFPSLNRLSFWMTFTSWLKITASFFLSINAGINLWLISASVFSLAALFSALNFTISTFSGLFLACHGATNAAFNEDFVVGHFHLLMGIAATFSMLVALFFWFQKFFGCRLDETLGKIHFWMTFVGVYAIFMPLHWIGLQSQPSLLPHAHRIPMSSAVSSFGTFITVAAIATAAAQVLFVFNFLDTLGSRYRNRRYIELTDPWRATTLEWSIPSPAPDANFGALFLTVYRGATNLTHFLPQVLSPELLVQKVL